MERDGNAFIVGIVAVIAILGATAVGIWLSGARTDRERVRYHIAFPGSVAGLRTGSAILFNGIPVGTVKKLSILANLPDSVMVEIMVDQGLPIKPDTEVRLAYQGLTGIASVELRGGTASATTLPSLDDGVDYIIQAEKSQLQDFIEGLRLTMERLTIAADRLVYIVDSNDSGIRTSVENVRVFTQSLADNSAALDTLLSAAGNSSERFSALSGQVEVLTGDLARLTKAIDPQRVRNILGHLEVISQSVAKSSVRLDIVFEEAVLIASDLGQVTSLLLDTVGSTGSLIEAIDHDTVTAVVRGIETFVATLNRVGDNTVSVTDGAQKLVSDLRKLAGNVEGAVGAIAETTAVEGDAATESFLGSVSATLVSIRSAADALEKNMGSVSRTIDHASEGGVRSVQEVSRDASRALQQFERLMRQIEKDPGRFFFGGSNTPRYQPR